MEVEPKTISEPLANPFGLEGDADPRQRAWVEVSPNCLERNTRIVKSLLSNDCQLMAVVKADGYGHGALVVASASIRGGASQLGVATLQEGIELRKAGFEVPILLLGSLVDVEDLRACLHWQLMPTLSTIHEVNLCEKLAIDSGRKFSVQLKIDTGMTRLGCDLSEAPGLVKTINSVKNVQLKGVYSHLALADGDLYGALEKEVTQQQKERFDQVLRVLPAQGDGFFRHIANSAGTLRDKALHYDMVRVGLALYGYSPIKQLIEQIDFSPALALKARVNLIREVPKGVGVSYGHRFITKRKTRLAVVGIGYADGVVRSLSGSIFVLINGQLLPQIGAITMDQMVVDATDCQDLAIGSVVTILGKDGDQSIGPKDWSEVSGLIPWEILCSFKHRLPRIVI